MKTTHLNELRQSGISQGIIDLNFKSLEGDAIYEYLAYGCKQRLNSGRLPGGWLERYKHCEQGGWWCSGINLKTGGDLEWGCFKPDFPKIDVNKQKPIKYEHPKGESTEIFALRVDDETAKKISARYGVELTADNFWEQVLSNKKLAIILTEGAKKAAALLSHGFIAIALPGIWAGYRREAKQTHGLLPVLAELAGHTIVFAFDQDAKSETRRSVKTAISNTSQAFSQFGCPCKTVNWKEEYKGVDDLLSANPELFVAALKNSKEVDCSDGQRLRDEISLLIEQGLSGGKLSTALLMIGKSHSTNSQVIRAIYKEIIDEREREDGRSENISELELIEKANGAKLDLCDVIPARLAIPIQKHAEMLGLRGEGHLTAFLVGLSSLGNPETELLLHSDWGFTVTPGLYGGIVANSSQRKSVVIKTMITKALGKIQREEKERFEAEMAEWKIQSDRYAALKSSKKPDELQEEFPEGEPKKPVRALRYCTDMNGEGLKRQLVETPNQGILGLADELVSLFKSANQYRGGKGSDIEDMLSLYDGTGVSILRKSEVTDVERALFSIFGATQPEVLKAWIDDGRDANGQWGRFVFVFQPISPAYMNGDSGTFNIDPMIEWVYREKAKLPAQKYVLTKAAQASFEVAHNYYETERVKTGEHNGFGNMLGKTSGRIGKLAITLHEVKYICLGQIPPREIDVDTIRAAIKLAAFYCLQTRYLYSRFSDATDTIAPHLFKILDLSNRVGEITPRIVKKYNISKDTDSIVCWFRELVAMGKGTLSEGRTVKFTSTVQPEELSAQEGSAEENPNLAMVSEEMPKVLDFVEEKPKVGDRRYSSDHYCEGEITWIGDDSYTVYFDSGLTMEYKSTKSILEETFPVSNRKTETGSAQLPETLDATGVTPCTAPRPLDRNGQALFEGATVTSPKTGMVAVIISINGDQITIVPESAKTHDENITLSANKVVLNLDPWAKHTDKSVNTDTESEL